VIDPVLVVAWLVFAHLVADFVLQNDWIALNKARGGSEGWRALLVHGGHVGFCLLPVALAFGLRGIAYIALVTISHMVVDRWKVQATRRADAGAQEAAQRRRASGIDAPSGLGSAWTPMPGVLFLGDQVLHLLFAIVGWLVILEGGALTGLFVDMVDTTLRDWDRTLVHTVVLTSVVLLSLLIVNTRGAYYFVLALVSPRDIAEPAAGPAAGAGTGPATAPQGYTVRVGPLVATVEPSAGSGSGSARAVAGGRTATATASPAAPSSAPAEPLLAPASNGQAPGTEPAGARAPVVARTSSVPVGAPARIGATIGALERLLVVAFVLTGAEVAIGFVVAAKTIARFRQLDDRGFAEYYLLGTLASISVALGSGLVGAAALATLR
jgi:hypothetical protein